MPWVVLSNGNTLTNAVECCHLESNFTQPCHPRSSHIIQYNSSLMKLSHLDKLWNDMKCHICHPSSQSHVSYPSSNSGAMNITKNTSSWHVGNRRREISLPLTATASAIGSPGHKRNTPGWVVSCNSCPQNGRQRKRGTFRSWLSEMLNATLRLFSQQTLDTLEITYVQKTLPKHYCKEGIDAAL